MNLFLDIETIPSQRADVLDALRAEVEQDATAKAESIRQQYKKPETIEAHLRELRESLPALVDEAHRKTALDGSFGEVLVIGWAFDDEPAETLTRKLDGSEPKLLRAFLDKLPPGTLTVPHWIGHNIGFDLRFIWQRCLVHGIAPPTGLPVDGRDNLVFDTMTEWAGLYNRDRWPTLERLCRVFGLPSPKGDLDGSRVWDFAKAGRIEEIADYCRRDVEAVRQIYRAITKHLASAV